MNQCPGGRGVPLFSPFAGGPGHRRTPLRNPRTAHWSNQKANDINDVIDIKSGGGGYFFSPLHPARPASHPLLLNHAPVKPKKTTDINDVIDIKSGGGGTTFSQKPKGRNRDMRIQP